MDRAVTRQISSEGAHALYGARLAEGVCIYTVADMDIVMGGSGFVSPTTVVCRSGFPLMDSLAFDISALVKVV